MQEGKRAIELDNQKGETMQYQNGSNNQAQHANNGMEAGESCEHGFNQNINHNQRGYQQGFGYGFRNANYGMYHGYNNPYMHNSAFMHQNPYYHTSSYYEHKNSLLSWLGESSKDRFIRGVVVGALATYLLTNQKAQKAIIKTGLKLYSSVVGGFEEFKEKIMDAKAELEANK